MIRDLLIIHITGLGYLAVASFLQHLCCNIRQWLEGAQPPYVLVNLFCHRAGEHARIRSGIGGEFFFIEFLHDPKRLIRTDFKISGTVVLQFRQIIQKRRVLLFLFPFNFLNYRLLFWLLLQKPYQFLSVFLFQKAVLLVQKRRLIPG